MRLRRILGWVVVVVAAVGVPVALWVVSSKGVSPEQRVADAEPPPPPVVEVAVEERVLRDAVVFRGVVTAVGSVPVGAPNVGDVNLPGFGGGFMSWVSSLRCRCRWGCSDGSGPPLVRRGWSCP